MLKESIAHIDLGQVLARGVEHLAERGVGVGQAARGQTQGADDDKFEPTAHLGGQSLVLNGAAIRYKAIFKVYAVGLYVPTKTSEAEEVLSTNTARRVQMAMLREVGEAELGRDFTEHFKDNTTPEEVNNSIPQLFRFGELFATRICFDLALC